MSTGTGTGTGRANESKGKGSIRIRIRIRISSRSSEEKKYFGTIEGGWKETEVCEDINIVVFYCTDPKEIPTAAMAAAVGSRVSEEFTGTSSSLRRKGNRIE